jgi:hypothetical protein
MCLKFLMGVLRAMVGFPRPGSRSILSKNVSPNIEQVEFENNVDEREAAGNADKDARELSDTTVHDSVQAEKAALAADSSLYANCDCEILRANLNRKIVFSFPSSVVSGL